MKKLFLMIVIIASCISSAYAIRKKYILPELEKPTTIVINDNLIAIEDGTSVKLYSADDFKYIKSIGREGQGPGEFQDFANPQILPEFLLINSSNKISYFSLSGDLIEEIRHINYYPLKSIGNKYVGCDWNRPQNYIAYLLYDSDVKPIKELHRGKPMLNWKDKRWDLFEIFFYDTYRDKIVLAHRDGSGVSVFDAEGNLSHSIKPPFKPKAFTEKDREGIFKYWREELKWPQTYIEGRKKTTNFPDYFPTIFTCVLADEKIYIITYEVMENLSRCLIYNLNGTFKKSVPLPVFMVAPQRSAPLAIKSNKLYQLIFNDENEKWELVIDPFDEL